MDQQSRWFTHNVRVRYQETDKMGVVYHTNYLNWFEIGRTELIRELGVPYRQLEANGLLLPVIELESKFRAPAKYDDQVVVWTRIVEFNTLMVRFESQVRLLTDAKGADLVREGQEEPAGELLVSGGTKHMWVNREWKPVRIHKEAPDLFHLLEKQQIMDGE
jgi:acyl-CoA thioester hydrolase